MKNKKYLKNYIFIYLFIGLFLVSSSVMADIVKVNYHSGGTLLPTSADTGLSPGIGKNPVVNLLSGVVTFVTSVVAVIAILMIVISGIMYITSAGDDKRVETAKNMLTYAIIGLIVALLGFVIVSTVSNMLGAG